MFGVTQTVISHSVMTIAWSYTQSNIANKRRHHQYRWCSESNKGCVVIIEKDETVL